MFDKTIDFLSSLEGTRTVSVALPEDADGYLDRQCPFTSCNSTFKVLGEHWDEKVRDEEVFCPVCRHSAAATQWATEEQLRYAEEKILAQVQGDLDAALSADADAFNRAQRGSTGLISMSMSFSPDSPPIQLSTPVLDAMRQRYSCSECACAFATVGAGFFCPACGKESHLSTFDDTIAHARFTLGKVDELASFAESSGSPGSAALVRRELVEATILRLVAAFQTFAELTYLSVPGHVGKLKKNVFQRLDDSSTLWKNLIGEGYQELLSTEQYDDLVRLFQQRHLLEHRGGIVDAIYIAKSGDMTYAVGQRLVLHPDNARRYLDVVEALASALRDRTHGGPA